MRFLVNKVLSAAARPLDRYESLLYIRFGGLHFLNDYLVSLKPSRVYQNYQTQTVIKEKTN